MATPTHEVIHPSWYVRTNGKLEAVEVGTRMVLSAKKGKDLVDRGYVKSLKKVKTLDTTDKPTE